MYSWEAGKVKKAKLTDRQTAIREFTTLADQLIYEQKTRPDIVARLEKLKQLQKLSCR